MTTFSTPDDPSFNTSEAYTPEAIGAEVSSLTTLTMGIFNAKATDHLTTDLADAVPPEPNIKEMVCLADLKAIMDQTGIRICANCDLTLTKKCLEMDAQGKPSCL